MTLAQVENLVGLMQDVCMAHQLCNDMEWKDMVDMVGGSAERTGANFNPNNNLTSYINSSLV